MFGDFHTASGLGITSRPFQKFFFDIAGGIIGLRS